MAMSESKIKAPVSHEEALKEKGRTIPQSELEPAGTPGNRRSTPDNAGNIDVIEHYEVPRKG
jgi:hypothetical protein